MLTRMQFRTAGRIGRWSIVAAVYAMAGLFVCPGPFAHAGTTGKIAGKVTDARTREPLVGANILIVGTTQGASSDMQGDYFITNVQPGVYDLRVKEVGYKEALITGVRVRVDATTEVNITMEQTVVEMGEEIVVTASRPMIQQDNTTSRVFIESQQITALPTAELTDIVTTVPSINVENGVLKVRGGTMNEVSVLIDGARARNPLNQEAYTNVNLGSIQEMEVITGSYNAEYGEARSGVFNILTKEGGEKYQVYLDFRYTPPGVKHWGESLYDLGSPLYWENANARHPQWWIDYPDMWVDPNGYYGTDPRCTWTPEQAYNDYVATHQPLTDYTNRPGYWLEGSLGGPVPFVGSLYFFISGRYRTEAPLMGNAYRDPGKFFDGTAKLTYQFDANKKLLASGFWGTEKTSWGIQSYPDYFWALNFGIDSRYAYWDFDMLPEIQTDGQTLKYTHVLDPATLYELQLSRVHAKRKRDIFPDDPIGWSATGATYDYLRAVKVVVDSNGNEVTQDIKGGNKNRIGYHTLGYYYRYDDDNTDLTFSGLFSSQLSKAWYIKTGLEFTYYTLNHYNAAKFPDRTDDRVYNPYQGDVFVQTKFEYIGFIMNLGLRFDFYNPNDVQYSDLFNPLVGPTEETKTFSQFSPRLGISHPIDDKTVLHFSYGHFFQRGAFGDYGEGNSAEQSLGNLTTFVVDGSTTPWVLGNRLTKPEKTISYEVGIERSFFDLFLLNITGYYKDIRNTVRVVSVESPLGVYRTNGNGDYADVRGLEISLRKQASAASWGTTWGYANFTTQIGITGRSGDPDVITPEGVRYAPSGDYIAYNNPRLKLGIYYQTPAEMDFLAGLLSRLSFSVDYLAVFPNEQLFQDFFVYKDQKYIRPVDGNTNLRIRKDISIAQDRFRIGLYVDVRNLFNDQWINFAAIETASPEDQKKFVESDFEYVPSVDKTGAPILDLAKYRNLPRSLTIGATIEF